VCASGEKAEFVAGGEIPLVVATQNQFSVEWKKFGIVLGVTPTADRSGNIATDIHAEVNDLDRSISIRANGFEVPGFRLRDVKTNVTVREGETVILSGLYSYSEDKEVSKVPLLGHLPILGELFKSRSFVDRKTELAIYVTPRLVSPFFAPPGTVAATSCWSRIERGRHGGAACISVLVVAGSFEPTRGQRRAVRRNADLTRAEVPAEATREQFALLRTYLDSRHAGGGMSDMGLFDYVAMVEETPVETHIVEYRRLDQAGGAGPLLACALIDVLRDGLSMVYSFFDPCENSRSLGTLMILDQVREARARGLPYVYLGYWISGSDKMAYKSLFQPLEALTKDGWERINGAGPIAD